MKFVVHPKTGLQYFITGNPHINKLISSISEANDFRTTYIYDGETASNKDFNLINFSIFPNPSTSVVKIDDSSFSLKKIEVYNLLGEKIITSTKKEINIQNLSNGVYLLKLETESGNFATQKIIKN